MAGRTKLRTRFSKLLSQETKLSKHINRPPSLFLLRGAWVYPSVEEAGMMRENWTWMVGRGERRRGKEAPFVERERSTAGRKRVTWTG